MKWIKHMSDSSNDEFLVELEDIFGLEGYARWWKLLEAIAAQMKEKNDCSAAYPLKKWQTLLRVKQKKLETFLEHLEKKQKIYTQSTGNILRIKCPKLLEIRDNHLRNLQATNKKVALDKDTDTDKDTDKDKDKESVLEILSYLNECADKNYRPVRTNLIPIKARLLNGYSVADCKKAIDNMVREWKGNSQWDRFLRPITLFSEKKFDGYLNTKHFSARSKGSAKLDQVKDWLPNSKGPETKLLGEKP